MDQIELNKKEMMSKKVWAVVGATPDQQKFGYKIYKKLKDHGYKVYGVNPKYTEIEGDLLYKSIAELPEKPQCVDMVVNPTVTMATLEDIHKSGIEYVWFQPGTFDEEVIDKAEALGLKIVYYDCVLVELDKV
ncbi:CoA-binding protein [Alkaliphilus transvaalensis]|uniref:CoA-binding protein n=1 Tax=Alkaliphilus transvaalensis TaxID=114628 RepID=UPI00047E16CD|nr:CoA-binding protein [Alkaliphilus transvaalensis]